MIALYCRFLLWISIRCLGREYVMRYLRDFVNRKYPNDPRVPPVLKTIGIEL